RPRPVGSQPLDGIGEWPQDILRWKQRHEHPSHDRGFCMIRPPVTDTGFTIDGNDGNKSDKKISSCWRREFDAE
ncbi:hypothetical protein, partial [Protofrankia symbiont of Coriaria myrtifolia]|uniref:hypothetical protein n=1 Tax=Protofrankia symbiont of Coriaria myrtifolia TaxID=1306540 RepID=UPI001A94CB3A